MSKVLTIGGMVVAAVVFLLFTADLFGFPFGRASIILDAGMIVAAAILGWLSWNAFSEIK